MAREEETFLLLLLPIDGGTFARKNTSFTFKPLTTPIGFFECVLSPAILSLALAGGGGGGGRGRALIERKRKAVANTLLLPAFSPEKCPCMELFLRSLEGRTILL